MKRCGSEEAALTESRFGGEARFTFAPNWGHIVEPVNFREPDKAANHG